MANAGHFSQKSGGDAGSESSIRLTLDDNPLPDFHSVLCARLLSHASFNIQISTVNRIKCRACGGIGRCGGCHNELHTMWVTEVMNIFDTRYFANRTQISIYGSRIQRGAKIPDLPADQKHGIENGYWWLG